jgi:flagellar hook-associated protein 3 FlgL
MRVTNDTLRQAFMSAFETVQRQIARTQTQVSTGRKINTPSDDPLGAAQIGRLEASLSRLDQYQANGIIAKNQLALEEEALVGVIDNLQRVRELAVQANNATLDNQNRASIAMELRQRLDSILALANATDASGRYLFSGTSESTRPFVMTAAGVVYHGDQTQRSLQVSDERVVAVNDSGAEVFQRIRNGNGVFKMAAAATNTGTGVLGAGSVVDHGAYVPGHYTIEFLSPTDYEVRDGTGAVIDVGTHSPGQAILFGGIEMQLSGEPAAGDSFTVEPSTAQDIFTTLSRLITALETPVIDAASRAALNNSVGQLMTDIDRGISHMIETRAPICARLHALEQESAMNEAFSVHLAESLSSLRDLDYAEALSLLTQQLFGLEVAQKTFARTQGLSLFRDIQ